MFEDFKKHAAGMIKAMMDPERLPVREMTTPSFDVSMLTRTEINQRLFESKKIKRMETYRIEIPSRRFLDQA